MNSYMIKVFYLSIAKLKGKKFEHEVRAYISNMDVFPSCWHIFLWLENLRHNGVKICNFILYFPLMKCPNLVATHALVTHGTATPLDQQISLNALLESCWQRLCHPLLHWVMMISFIHSMSSDTCSRKPSRLVTTSHLMF